MSSAITPTIAQGIPAKGATNLTSVPAGYVGERIYAESTGAVSLTTGLHSTGGNSGITLEKGVYIIRAVGAYFPASGTTITTVGVGVSIGDSGTTSAGLDFATSYSQVKDAASGNTYGINLESARYYVVTSETQIFPKMMSRFTGSTATASCYIEAIRIA